MPQFFLPPEGLAGGRFRLSGREAEHAAKSRRLGPGDLVELFDGSGRRFLGEIGSVGRGGDIEGRIVEERTPSASRPAPRVTLHLALLKARGWELSVEKATELGVSRIMPVACERSVVSLESRAKIESFLARSRRVAMAASKQCGRAELPAIEPPRDFEEAIAGAREEGPVLLAWEGAGSDAAGWGMRETLSALKSGFRQGSGALSVFIGPEGGFSPREIEAARRAAAVLCGLGPNILRSETAAIAALSAVFYEIG